jgi:hypothetical protein
MNISDMRFPRQLEADCARGSCGVDAIRHALAERSRRLWPGGEVDVPLIAMSGPLRKALRAAVLKGRMCCGFEEALKRLDNEKAGIAGAGQRSGVSAGGRVSRLILLSNDGAERFYRHVEQLLRSHAPRLLVCSLDTDSGVLGRLITGRDRQIKLVMAEHKDAVSEILRAILDERADGGTGHKPGSEPA